MHWRILILCWAFLFYQYVPRAQEQREINFCGESVPTDKVFVAEILMNAIRKQIPNVNLPALRKRAELNFPTVEKYLSMYGLPLDLKYLPIVESGFVGTVRSRQGAYGFWQIMPKTATGLGLRIDSTDPRNDERTDIHKASDAGCRYLKELHNSIKKTFNIASWSLAAAAYNYGISNMTRNIRKQGHDYYTMQLNPETAVYVYKIIAVKELFEYPELYMKSFGYNVFNPSSSMKMKKGGDDKDEVFRNLLLGVSNRSLEKKSKPPKYITAHITGKYKRFKDGGLVTIILDEDLTTSMSFSRKGYSFGIQGWVIDDRVYFDLGYGHALTLYDSNLKKGVTLRNLKKSRKHFPVILQNVDYPKEN